MHIKFNSKNLKKMREVESIWIESVPHIQNQTEILREWKKGTLSLIVFADKLTEEDDTTFRLIINPLVRMARLKMDNGFAYSIDDLLPVDKLSDKTILGVMKRLDTHPRVKIDTRLPRKWSKL